MQTRAVHPPAPETGLLGRASAPPVHRTATFTFDSSDSFATVMSDHTRGYAYSRIDNPTSDAFAQAVAGLEGGQDGQPFASGMAAITTTLLAFLSAGDHVVAQRRLYGGTHHVLTRVLPRWGIGVSFADSPQEAAAAMTDTTRLVWCETISNPTLRVADIPALAAVAHAAWSAARSRLDVRDPGRVPPVVNGRGSGGALRHQVHRWAQRCYGRGRRRRA